MSEFVSSAVAPPPSFVSGAGDWAAPEMGALAGRIEWQIRGAPGDGRRLVAALVGDRAAEALPVGARDRLLGAVYAQVFGPRVLASRHCGACGAPYDFDFRLADLEAALEGVPCPPEIARLDAAGHAVLASGHVLRPLTLADEAAVAALPLEAAEAALLERALVVAPEGAVLDPEVAGRVLEWLSPALDTDLEGACPECGAREVTRFAIEPYLMRALAGERRQLLREVHLIAASYGWSQAEILGLSRDDRRQLAALIEAERRGPAVWGLG